MFILNNDKTKLEFVGDGFKVVRSPDPNRKPGLGSGEIKNLVIHPVQASTTQNAINQFLSNAKSLHLLIARDGKEIVQMVDFDQMAVHARDYDHNSLGIGVIYPGYLTDKPGFFYSRDHFDPLRIVFAQGINDNKKRWFPLYPQVQLDALFEITSLLVQAFGIGHILMRQEINKFDLITGPVFPINRLRQMLQGENAAADLQEQTSSEADLYLQPGGVGPKLLDKPIPPQTAITVIDEDEGWMLVEVMGQLEERRWTVGWMDADKVVVKPFEPSIDEDHMLTTGDNRRIKFIAAHEKNYNANEKLDPRYVVIHFTTGTNMMSTVHTFLNPDNGVSTHLLVGRTGQVMQFVPFDRVAFHCGLSTWEGQRFLNGSAIGIEIDNAGLLRKTTLGYKSRDKYIPANQMQCKKHWKEGGVRAWQTFTPVQIEVVEKIVKALKQKYPTINEILGHDMINLRNRLDPGPLYPLGELRKAILGDPQPVIKPYRTAEKCPIYENIDFTPPRVLPHPDMGELPKNSTVRVREVHDKWAMVKVKVSSKSSLRDKTGWVLSRSIALDEEKSRTKFSQTFYEVIPAVVPRLPPLVISSSPLPEGTYVRKQFDFPGGRWTLIAPVFDVQEVEEDDKKRFEVLLPRDKVKKYFREGWVERKFLEEA